MAKTAGKIHIGIGGWVFEPWRGTFYPGGLAQKRELEYAASKLTSIEINGTYYGSQKPESFAKWREETPEDFIFALKGSRFCTNRRVLAEAGPSVEKFLTSGLTELKHKLGPINWQFMPTKKFDPEDFEAFLKLLPKELDGIKLRHAVEVRHDSFRSPDFIALLRECGVAAITSADADYTQIADVTAPFVYARIMGTKEAEPKGYSDAGLTRWAKAAQSWAKGSVPEGLEPVGPPAAVEPRDVFLYVISGDKVRNPAAAMELIARTTD
ncbi:DUF72 domain-containing protein [Bosea thiooxidans]|nr:DUF72 domain-containing protein [Bosea sp. (in: a-proteobacteria)]